MSGVCRVFYKTLGIKRGAPTTIEQEFFKTWTKDYGFGEDIVEEACKRAVLHTQNPTIKYVNGILTAWHNAGVTDFAASSRKISPTPRQPRTRKPLLPRRKAEMHLQTYTEQHELRA